MLAPRTRARARASRQRRAYARIARGMCADAIVHSITRAMACIHALSTPRAQAMLTKWRDVLGEADFADAFDRSWGRRPFTRAQLNEGQEGSSGTPHDNNALEAKNRAQKDDAQYLRQTVPTFLHWMANWLENESRRDLTFEHKFSAAVFNRPGPTGAGLSRRSAAPAPAPAGPVPRAVP